MKKLPATDAAYIAGFIDGEGSIFLYRKRPGKVALRLAIGNTDKAVLEWIAEVTGCTGTLVAKRTKDVLRHKQAYHWNPGQRESAQLLEAIRPYLRIKAQQADLALDFIRRYAKEKGASNWQEEYRLEMEALNRNGPEGN